MYAPPPFGNRQEEFLEDFIVQNPLGTLVSYHQKLDASFIPFLIEKNEDKWILSGHIAKANLQNSLPNFSQVMVLFSGADHYISSSWYNHLNVPTWNYSAIQIHGQLTWMTEPELMELLKKTVEHFEAPMQCPMSFDSMSEKTKEYLPEISGFFIEIETWQGTIKHSQNRNSEDLKRIDEQLREIDTTQSTGMADAMRKTNVE